MNLINTPEEFHALLKPFEDYRRAHTFNGPNTYIDIRHGAVDARGANIRQVTDEGVEVFFSSRCELIPFDAIKSVTIRSADLYKTLSTVTYSRDALKVAA